MIGRNYRIIRKLGHGGEGTIYLVQHGPTEQLRAAKLLKTDVPERRRHELDMMKRLRHPALPQIYDVLEERGDFWIIMEFIRGKTLSELCAEEQVNPIRFFSIARQLAEALAYLHSRKPPVLHLDIKPSNIMIRQDGSIALIDFGAAVRADAKTGTASLGTPGFAAPEQWDPNAEPDMRADYYGFGAVLYYYLYGSVPRERDETRKRSLCGDGRRKKAESRGVGHGFEGAGWRREAASLIRQCMQKDRAKRFQDAQSLYRKVRRAERRYLAWKRARRSGAAIVFLLAAAAFASANLSRNVSDEAAAAQIKHSYEELLEQADGLGFAQAASCYEQAAALCPENGVWCEKLLDRIESDYIFDPEEEAALKKLMFSVPPGRGETEEELLRTSASEYGRLAYRIGIIYWYFYEGTGGKSAAAKWFRRAVAWQEGQDESSRKRLEKSRSEITETKKSTSDETDGISEAENETPMGQKQPASWLESARIHAKTGDYYETLGKQNPDGDEMTEIRTYWEDLVSLWRSDSLKQEAVRIQCEVAQELAAVLVMQSAELKKEGVSVKQLRRILSSIELFLDENPKAGRSAEICREQYRAAEEALERLTENERGSELDTEKKK